MTMMTPVTPAPAEARNDALAVFALLGGLFLFPLGIVFGHLSCRDARAASRRYSPLAVTGLVLGYAWLSLVLGVLLYLMYPAPAAFLIPPAVIGTVAWVKRRQRRRAARGGHL